MSRSLIRRIINTIIPEANKVADSIIIQEESKSGSKPVYVFKDNKCIGVYDSITKCGLALGYSRLVIRKAIGDGSTLENGFTLKFTNK